MSTAIDKAKISGIVAVLGAVSTLVYGYANLMLLAGLSTFLITLMIQYSSLKVKILVPAAALFGVLVYSSFNNGGVP